MTLTWYEKFTGYIAKKLILLAAWINPFAVLSVCLEVSNKVVKKENNGKEK